MSLTTPAHPPRTRLSRPTRVSAGILGAAALILAAPLAASAHVHVTPDGAEANASTRLAFSFSHGCDDSPTTALEVTIPEGVDGVTPVLDGAWTITRELGDDGIPDRVVYTAVNPIESGISASVAMDVIFGSSVANSDIAFPVLQRCAEGETDWAEVAAEGQSADELESPAPVVAVGDVAEASSGHGHGSADATDEADEADEADAGHADAVGTEADPVARWLSGGALVAAVAALLIALGRRRRA